MATIARSRPVAIALSTLRRASALSEPWWIPIGSASSFAAHRSRKISSATARVLTKTIVSLCAAISLMTSVAA